MLISNYFFQKLYYNIGHYLIFQARLKMQVEVFVTPHQTYLVELELLKQPHSL